MKLWLLVFFVALIGLISGVGASYFEIGRVPKDPTLQVLHSDTHSSGRPVVVIDSEHYNFGSMPRNSNRTHVFTIRNEGDAPLTLGTLQTTCKCTLGDLATQAIPPGESTTATLEWTADTGEGEFRQEATIQTNDPLRPVIVLSVFGKVSFTYQVLPSTIVFDNLSAHSGGSASARLVTSLPEAFEISQHEFLEPGTAELFELEITPLPKEELGEDQTSGSLITVQAKPGLPFEPLRQTLRLQTSLPTDKDGTIEIPIEGTVRGDINIVGPQYSAANNTLNLGNVRSSQGAKSELRVFVSGPHRENLNIEPVSSVPEGLVVTVGEPQTLGSRTLVLLTVEVPAGLPQGNYLGSQQGELGEILLRTSHPQNPELRIRVRLLIEG